MKKRFLSILLTLCMVLTLLPAVAFAATLCPWRDVTGSAMIYWARSVYALLEASDGTIYAGTWGDGVWAYNGTVWSNVTGSAMTVGAHSVVALLEAGDGKIYAGTDDGVWTYNGKGWSDITSSAMTGYAGEVNALLEASDGTIYAGTSNGVWAYNGTGWSDVSGSAMDSWARTVFTLLEASDGTIYAGTRSNNVWAYNGTAWSIAGSATNSPGNNVLVLLEASDGTIYAGTQGNGVCTYNGTTWSNITGSDMMTKARFVHSLLETSDGTIYAGAASGSADGNGVWEYDGTNWSDVTGSAMTGAARRVRSMLQTSDGTIYAGTSSGGVWMTAVPVAAIGSTLYPSLKAAIADVGQKQTITLLRDITDSPMIDLNSAPSSTAEYTLDLGNYTITGNQISILSFSDAKTVNLTANAGGGVTNTRVGYRAIFVDHPNAVLNIKHGTYTGEYSAMRCIKGQVIITAGVFNGGTRALIEEAGATISLAPGSVATPAKSAWSTAAKVTVTGAISTAPSITTTSLPKGVVGSAYSQTLTAAGSTPITWTISSGALPNGLSLTGNTISGTPATAGSYTFTVKAANGTSPDATQTLTIVIESAKPGADSWENPFTDVNEEHWFYADVQYVYENGLFSGTSATTFSPTMPMTRGMVVTVLGRIAGININDYSGASFDDVNTTQYYAPYVKWAAEMGIVSGVGNNKFAPDANIRRQDIAAILYRYAEKTGITLPKVATAITFSDDANISGYAKEAVAAMQRAGIINGKPGNIFDPNGIATRAEVAAMLHRFAETVK